MSNMEAASAEAAAIASQRQVVGRRKMVMGINVAPYAGFRVAGIDNTKIFATPEVILKNAVPGATYCWRKPDDPTTVSMVNRGILAPITADQVDTQSRYANYELRKILTQTGPKQVVRSPGGLGLFRVNSDKAMKDDVLGDLPGSTSGAEGSARTGLRTAHREPDHWEKAYMADLAGEADRFSEDVEQLSSMTVGARMSGELTRKDERREPVV